MIDITKRIEDALQAVNNPENNHAFICGKKSDNYKTIQAALSTILEMHEGKLELKTQFHSENGIWTKDGIDQAFFQAIKEKLDG